MADGEFIKQRLRRIVYFFPFQLFFLHLKKNHLLLLFWLVLFGYVTQSFAAKYGVPYLFLYPEYLGEVGFWSFAILGFSCGGFIMAFNIYTYILHGFRFPFIATLSRPFLKWSINNFIIPFAFVVTYLYQSIHFQLTKEFLPIGEITVNIFGFLVGMGVFFFLSLFYFFRTNKDISKIAGKSFEEVEERQREKAVKTATHKKNKWYKRLRRETSWKVLTYMSGPFRVKLARDSSHYDKEVLKKVFWQNHINASFFELLMIGTFLLLGSFRETAAFTIPASASIVLLFTMLLMVISALFSWFKGWAFAILIGIILLINYGSQHYDFMNFTNQAYGLNYHGDRAPYSTQSLANFSYNKSLNAADVQHTIGILSRWKQRNVHDALPGSKPKLIIIHTSGGGLRSSLWTYRTMQYTDSVLNGELMQHTQLIAGSSGGMIGAAYLRELYLQSLSDSSVSIYDKQHCHNISKDLLNPIAFSIATTDMFIRYQRFEVGGYSYLKDRAYSFERGLLENTNQVLDKKLSDYQQPEAEAIIPMMIFSPSIINDGRRLLVAAQPISFLCNSTPETNVSNQPLVENVEFNRLLANQDARNLRFTSALRMSATFPYIMPVVSLPTEPRVDVMDAGLRDNYGIKTSLQYLYTFRDWISSNTSGVVLIKIRDRQKDFELKNNGVNSLFATLGAPIGTYYNNFTKIQDYNHDQLLQHASEWFDGSIDVVNFNLRHGEEDNISLSWHLTQLERKQVLNAIYLPENQGAIEQLKDLLK